MRAIAATLALLAAAAIQFAAGDNEYLVLYQRSSFVANRGSIDSLLGEVTARSVAPPSALTPAATPGFRARLDGNITAGSGATSVGGAHMWLSEDAAEWLANRTEVLSVELVANMTIVEPDVAVEGSLSVAGSSMPRTLCSERRRLRRQARALQEVDTQSGLQASSLWGLDRIDDRTLVDDSTYQYAQDGAGVYIFVVDTGIRSTHTEFGDRVDDEGYSATGNDPLSDCNGHGTHVSGIAAGTTVGVAKSANLIAVQVFGCEGDSTTLQLAQGLQYVSERATQLAAAGYRSIVNMSLGGSSSSFIDSMIEALYEQGLIVVVAAGNDYENACSYSPARATNAVTVGATTDEDDFASFSNYGSCVDINAPGRDILSSWPTSDNAGAFLSGTSMATPFVAGAAARFVESNPASTPADFAASLTCAATEDVVQDVPSSTVSTLLYVYENGIPYVADGAACSTATSTSTGTPSSSDDATSTDDGGESSEEDNEESGAGSSTASAVALLGAFSALAALNRAHW